jgi:hypothetical protein
MAQTVYNSSGSSCGSISSDGTVYSKGGSSIGRIYSDGTVYENKHLTTAYEPESAE